MNPSNQAGIDFSKFDDLKKKGACRVVRLAPDHHTVVKRAFDPDTGMEGKPVVIQCDKAGVQREIKGLDEQIEGLQKHRAGLQALLDEMAATDAAAEVRSEHGKKAGN